MFSIFQGNQKGMENPPSKFGDKKRGFSPEGESLCLLCLKVSRDSPPFKSTPGTLSRQWRLRGPHARLCPDRQVSALYEAGSMDSVGSGWFRFLGLLFWVCSGLRANDSRVDSHQFSGCGNNWDQRVEIKDTKSKGILRGLIL